jgi:general secretion pathway protein H
MAIRTPQVTTCRAGACRGFPIAHRARPAPDGRNRRAARGFTLIELLVVLLVLTVTIGIIGLNLGDRDTDQVRDEAQRLTALLQTAHDEAILRGQVLAVQFDDRGYQFLGVDAEGKLVSLAHDDTLHPRQLPEGMTLAVELDGAPATGAGAGLLLDPTGQLPAFTVNLRLGHAVWQTRNESGQIQSVNPEAARAG